ncbi:uncharacterized protein VP01_1600g5 [Puccinia sorghi]|uniref:Uncharacterized protein n=1 Tax=Puccinia sorghi TaxID=27349 RepID=A0A0L6VJ62_9BASI|nr:uncharacterized protein VP01_1600g5 [Puccinia sorghi]
MRILSKSLAQVHNKQNPQQALHYNGSNSQTWERRVFTNMEANFNARSNTEKDVIACIIQSSIDKKPLGIVENTSGNDPCSEHMLIKFMCSRSGQRHKLPLIVGHWRKLMANPSPLKLTVDELVGLCIQNSFGGPLGVDAQTFRFSFNQHLESKKLPAFTNVATVIQLSLTKQKGGQMHLAMPIFSWKL